MVVHEWISFSRDGWGGDQLPLHIQRKQLKWICYLATRCTGTFEGLRCTTKRGDIEQGLHIQSGLGALWDSQWGARKCWCEGEGLKYSASACCYRKNTLIKYSVMCFLKCRPLCDSSATDARQTSLFKTYYVFCFNWFLNEDSWHSLLQKDNHKTLSGGSM